MGKLHFSTEEKNLIAQFLHQHYSNQEDLRVKYGKLREAAAKYGRTRQAIGNIWREARKQLNAGKPIQLGNNKKGPRAKKVQFNPEEVKAIEMKQRTTLQGIDTKLNVSKTTVWRWYNTNLIKAHTNAIKAELTNENMMHRLNFCLRHLHVEQSLNVVKFKSMQHIVHIDEKWFYLTKESERYYIVEGEEVVHRTCKSKRFITKVMFMCAIARPLYDVDGQVLFDGKIGIFPFTQQVPAQRKSKNRPRGTMETKPIASITREVTKQCLVNQVLPAIKAKWPEGLSKDILIQQDNCGAHIGDNDPEFRVASSSDGFNIHLVYQPPNSPYTNINDLGWFRALQALQHENRSHNSDDLIQAVEGSFEKLESYKLNNVFLSYQGCMIETMKARGQNNYKIPHMKKDSLIRQGILPTNLEVDLELVKETLDILKIYGDDKALEGLEELMFDINYD